MANVDFGAWQDTLYHLHRSIGAVLLPLVLCRLLWRLTHPAPPLPADIPAIQQFAAHATHWALYGLLILQAIVGWIATSAYRAPILVFWLFELPPIWREDKAFSEMMFTVHRAIGIAIALSALRPYRRGAVSPLHPQGRRADAHGERLSHGGTGNQPHDRRSHVPGGRHGVARKLDPVPADGIDGAARPASAAQHRHRAGRGVHRAASSSAGARPTISGGCRRFRSGCRASTTGRRARCRSRSPA